MPIATVTHQDIQGGENVAIPETGAPDNKEFGRPDPIQAAALQHCPPYPDIATLDSSNLAKDTIKFSLLKDSIWHDSHMYKFPQKLISGKNRKCNPYLSVATVFSIHWQLVLCLLRLVS